MCLTLPEGSAPFHYFTLQTFCPMHAVLERCTNTVSLWRLFWVHWNFSLIENFDWKKKEKRKSNSWQIANDNCFWGNQSESVCWGNADKLLDKSAKIGYLYTYTVTFLVVYLINPLMSVATRRTKWQLAKLQLSIIYGKPFLISQACDSGCLLPTPLLCKCFTPPGVYITLY